jgi:predicted RNA binding protein YcfA (HicA-like mRNA interferase family)
MKLPRDVSGAQLLQALKKLGYGHPGQRGSHVRITTQLNGEHHEAIPNHASIKVGTLNGILKSVAAHHKMTVQELIELLDL